jgi:dolichyl-phosphate beta-glucosyltransferase
LVSIVIPAFNEGPRVAAAVSEVSAWLRAHGGGEVIVVDDGSTDDTRVRLAAIDDPQLITIYVPGNRGKGAAVARGMLAARGDIVAFLDADLAYPLDQLTLLFERLNDGADVAIGARDLLPAENRAIYAPLRRAATSVFNAMVNASLGLRVRDTQCGFKAFRREAARALFSSMTIERFGFDVEVLYLAERWGMRVDRVPVKMRASTTSSVRIVHDSLNMAADVLRIRARAKRGEYPITAPVRPG